MSFLSGDDTEAADLIKKIDEMLEDGDTYLWAEDTLQGIRETVEKTGRVTERQQQAVRNIEEAG